MKNHKKLILLLVLICLLSSTACTFGNKTERIRKKMKSYLYDKYGEEFLVDRIGARSSRGQKFYQARIYPKSIIGTSKEGDDYYYASASVNKKSFGRLGKVGDSYPLVNLKLDIEEYLMSKTKKIFGERILMKIKAHYKKREPGNKTYWGYKVKSFKKARKLIAEDPENRMIELELYAYVFDRIEDKAEKEERRKDIFEFVQYLKDESLFECLEMGVIFIDERVLADSYDKYERKVYYSGKVKKVIHGERVKLPPMKLRKEMSKELQQEINEMSEKKLLANMKKIKKSELIYRGINKNNAQNSFYLYSPKLIKEKYKTALKKGILEEKKYLMISEITIKKEREYVYVNYNK